MPSVADRYDLDELLGRGGMGEVWRATDRRLERPVAIKRVTIPAHLGPDERDDARARVMREGRAAARVHHPSLVTMFDVFEDDEGAVVLVQELVDGRSLHDIVEVDGPLSPEVVARIGLDVLGGLEAAHASGVIHRDVKPGNVLVGDDGSARLTDFGIASIQEDASITGTGVLIGSPNYMAPEQAMGEAVGPATDLWGLGATLYTAVEGEPPFGRAETMATLAAAVHADPRPFERAGPLAPLLLYLLAKDPAGRPGPDETRRMLRHVAAGGHPEPSQPEPPGPAPPAVMAPSGPATTPLSAAEPAAPGPEQHRPTWLRPALVAAVAASLAAGAAAWAVHGSRSGTPAPARSTTAFTAGGPAGWQSYQDPATGYRVAYPPGWKVVKGAGNLTDFREPATGRYLRIDWTDHPGPSPEAAWRQLAPTFAARYSQYREIGIAPTTFQGHPAATWEFVYADGGALLHAVDLGFTTAGYGFALNFQTHDDQWPSSQDEWAAFEASFRPPA